MYTVTEIRTILTEAVHGTDREWYTEAELNAFANDLVSHNRVQMDTKERLANFICQEFIRYMDDHGNPTRMCSICGKLFHEGYCYAYGTAYYCGDECLHHDFTDEAWEKECREDDQSYYSEWY